MKTSIIPVFLMMFIIMVFMIKIISMQDHIVNMEAQLKERKKIINHLSKENLRLDRICHIPSIQDLAKWKIE